jgi:hypothetical protein
VHGLQAEPGSGRTLVDTSQARCLLFSRFTSVCQRVEPAGSRLACAQRERPLASPPTCGPGGAVGRLKTRNSSAVRLDASPCRTAPITRDQARGHEPPKSLPVCQPGIPVVAHPSSSPVFSHARLCRQPLLTSFTSGWQQSHMAHKQRSSLRWGSSQIHSAFRQRGRNAFRDNGELLQPRLRSDPVPGHGHRTWSPTVKRRAVKTSSRITVVTTKLRYPPTACPPSTPAASR